MSNITDGSGSVSVDCQSSHLTAFAVLVDVSGEVRVSDHELLNCTVEEMANYISTSHCKYMLVCIEVHSIQYTLVFIVK